MDIDNKRRYSVHETERTVSNYSSSLPNLSGGLANESSLHPILVRKIAELKRVENSKIKKQKKEGIDFNFCDNPQDEVIIGSVPAKLHYFNQFAQKKKVNELTGKKYVTIPSVSFTKHLSPENPIFTIGNKNARTKILISVGIHGDEPCGVIAFNELYNEGFFKNLSPDIFITALIGNPEAMKEGRRFLDVNLNRMVREDLFNNSTYEGERAYVVAQAINHCDVMMDLHSTSAPSPAHALPMDDFESIKLASKMPVSYVIKHLAHTTPGKATTLDWAKKQGKIGFGVECGQHDDKTTVENAKNCIKALICLISKRDIRGFGFSKPVVLNCYENETVRKGFKFIRNFSAFERVPYGVVIAVDEVVGPISSKFPNGTYLVMPTKKPIIGEEAFFYAERDN